MPDRLAGDLRIVKCPTCGKDKWAYMGDDLPEEPPCFTCQRKLEQAQEVKQNGPKVGPHDGTAGSFRYQMPRTV